VQQESARATALPLPSQRHCWRTRLRSPNRTGPSDNIDDLGEAATLELRIELTELPGFRTFPLKAVADTVGRTISHYEILEKLGEGGMGVVYKGRDTHLDRFVAIKVLPPERVTDPERRRRFTQEAKAASALNHPNIITIYDIASDNGIDFIAMEYVPGGTPSKPGVVGEAGALADLGKENCAKMLGFSSTAAAQAYFQSMTIVAGHLGQLQIENVAGGYVATVPNEPPPAKQDGKTITANYDYNWFNFSSVTAFNVTTRKTQAFDYLGAINAHWGTSMTTYDFSALLLLHEFKHALGAPQESADEAKGFNMSIYTDCIK
jgi:hypothetical protein